MDSDYLEWVQRNWYFPKTVSAAAYWTMLIPTNTGWIIGTVLYHWFS